MLVQRILSGGDDCDGNHKFSKRWNQSRRVMLIICFPLFLAPASEGIEMFSANYTASNICRAMGLGGFANDQSLSQTETAIRLLLKPSFHPELCITLVPTDFGVEVSTLLATSMIWHQSWPTPQSVATVASTGRAHREQFELLRRMLVATADAMPVRVVISDGMSVHVVLRENRAKACEIEANVGCSPVLEALVAQVILTAWQAADIPAVRNGLSDAGEYVGLLLDKEEIAHLKPVIHTIILGDQQEAEQLLAALKQHTGQ